METYKVIFNEQENKGVYALSVVEDPAMEGLFIALNKNEEIKFAKVDEEQHILMGVALIPDKLIYRNQGGREFNITFSKDTIKDIAHAFLKNGYQKESTIEHKEPIDGVSVVESWIIEDETHDKSRAFGFDYPVGSWMATMKVDNKELWTEYVKTGKIKGFSIDGAFGLEKIKLSNMSEKKESKNILQEFTEVIKTLLGSDKKEEALKLGSVKLDNDVTIEFEGERLEVGKEVYIKDEDGQNVPLPDGDYKTLEGFEFEVREGIVVEKEIKREEEVKEEIIEQKDAFDIKSALANLLTQLNTHTDEKIEALKVEFSKQIKAKDEEIKTLKEEPAEKKKVHTAELSNQTEPKNSKQRLLNTIKNVKE